MDDASLDDFLDTGERPSGEDEKFADEAEQTADDDEMAPADDEKAAGDRERAPDDGARAASDEPETLVAAGDEADGEAFDANDRENRSTSDERPAAGDKAKLTEAAVDPSRSTMTYAPEGDECAACGERVVRRWVDDGEAVCRDCKQW